MPISEADTAMEKKARQVLAFFSKRPLNNAFVTTLTNDLPFQLHGYVLVRYSE